MGERHKMKKTIYLAVLGVAAGEFMMFYGHVYTGIAIHIINLQAIAIALIFRNYPSKIKNVLQSMLLLLLLRIISVAMPRFFPAALLWYPLIYGVMFMPVYLIIKNQHIPLKEMGMDSRRLHIYLPASLFIGAAMALLEYRILAPAPLIENIRLPDLIFLATVMFVFVGAVEELIFRSILQTRLEKVFGLRNGILLSAALFGIMYSGYGLINEIIFATFFGIVLGYTFQKTSSFPFILAIHGSANVLLYGILPIVLP